MVVTLLVMGITTLVVLLSIYFHRSPVEPSDSAYSGQVSLSHSGVSKQDETEQDQASGQGGEGIVPPLDISLDHRERTAAPVATSPESVEHGISPASSQTGSGFFNNAQNVVMYQPVMNNISDTKEKVLKWLAKFTMSGVEFDASGHVPGCHPGTRITILQKLHHWVDDPQRVHQMLWLRGAAGVGKSAILQSLAEHLSEDSKLGATLFFSRPNNRNDSNCVFPTIAYQLAVRIPLYKEYLEQIMLRDPKLLEKDVERQFNALIVEPFTILSLTGTDCKWSVLLDGLDECDEEDAQILIVELISRFCRQHSASPLVWVIASRPEAHLRLTFNSQEVANSFEGLVVSVDSDEACRDVEKFLRAKFKGIHQRFRDVVSAGAPWPEERDITRISKTSSGLFALATTVARYVEDPHVCNPISQLATALSVTEGLEPGSLSTLYAFYSVILSNIPEAMSPILKLLLPFYAVLLQELTALSGNDNTPGYFPLVIVATIFGLQQHTIYAALRKLHSVINVPSFEDSGRCGIEFYHASFSDYLKTQGGYTLDIDMMVKAWWGYFNMLHGMDSNSYRGAISRKCPPVPLSWDVKLVDGASENLWEVGLGWLVHTLVPECRTQKKYSYTHPHSLLAGPELCNVFERIDFSTLFFTPIQRRIFTQILDLFNWLFRDAPPAVVQSGLVKIISLRDLDLGCIPEEKMALEFNWGIGSSMTITSYANSRKHRPLWVNPANSLRKIASKLNELNHHNVVIRALLVGRAPSRRCAFIYVEPSGKRRSSFYYVPYRK